jgi:nicotinamide-nucleotide amidase
MRGEIITIGDELLSGRVCDLNSFFLSGRISSYGLVIESISSVGDDETRIIEVLNRAVGRSEFVLVSGGLGPTEDDLTTRVAAKFFGRPLVLDQTFLRSIRNSLEKRGGRWVESYRKLAYLPEGAKLIDPDGEACGFYLEYENIPVFFLPGVPNEVRLLAETKVLPWLLKGDQDPVVVRQRVFKLFGPPEAAIGDVLEGLTAGEKGVMIGYYPNFPENHVTITVRAKTEQEAGLRLSRLESEVDHRLGRFIVAKDIDTVEDVVGRLMAARGLTLAVAESCTGGLISHRLTSVSGSSNYFDRGLVVYSNRAKAELLNVPRQVLDDFGAVSQETALAMAQGVRELSRTSLGLATTGIAGPTGGTPDKPVGTVYLALADHKQAGVKRFRFSGRRDQVTTLTAETALSWLQRYLIDDTFLFRHKPA